MGKVMAVYSELAVRGGSATIARILVEPGRLAEEGGAL